MARIDSERIQAEESRHRQFIKETARRILEERRRVVLITGPSSSGKTTFTRRLSRQLKGAGYGTEAISLDDYYREPSAMPLHCDLESPEALDLPRFHEDLAALLAGKAVELPCYNFKTKKRERGRTIDLNGDKVLLIEGIHALVPELTSNIPADCVFRIFLCAVTPVAQDGRLLRRMVRDSLHRAAPAEKTLSMWPGVREGEQRWILPHKNDCDASFDSGLAYELPFLKAFALPLLASVPPNSPYAGEAERLLHLLEKVPDASDGAAAAIPEDSILREFIGDGE